jgi:hypothetical protein
MGRPKPSADEAKFVVHQIKGTNNDNDTNINSRNAATPAQTGTVAGKKWTQEG